MGKHIKTSTIISFNILKDKVQDWTDEISYDLRKLKYEQIINLIAIRNQETDKHNYRNYNLGMLNLNYFFNLNDKLYHKSICEFEYMAGNNILRFTKSFDKNISNGYIKSLFKDDFIEIEDVKYF